MLLVFSGVLSQLDVPRISPHDTLQGRLNQMPKLSDLVLVSAKEQQLPANCAPPIQA